MEEKESSDWKGVALVLVGALLFSAKAVVVKLTYRYEITAIGSLFFRMFFAFPFFSLDRLEGRICLRQNKAHGQRLDLRHFNGDSWLLFGQSFRFFRVTIHQRRSRANHTFIYPTLVVVLPFFS